MLLSVWSPSRVLTGRCAEPSEPWSFSAVGGRSWSAGICFQHEINAKTRELKDVLSGVAGNAIPLI